MDGWMGRWDFLGFDEWNGGWELVGGENFKLVRAETPFPLGYDSQPGEGWVGCGWIFIFFLP